MPTHQTLLLLCRECWRAALPTEPIPVTSVHSYEDCFVCQQQRGIIYVNATIEWTPQRLQRPG